MEMQKIITSMDTYKTLMA